MNFSRGRSASFLLPAILMFLAFSAFAQDLDEVTIAGRILDSTGLAVVGATVTVTDQGSGATRTVTTNEDGRYRFIELRPGVYKIKAAATGFGAKERIDLTTVAGQNLQLDFSLSPADVQAETTVTVGDDDAPAVDTTRTIVGGTVSQREVEELPNESRNPLDLVLTLGGTSEEQLSTRDLANDRGARGISTPGTTPEEAGIFGLSGGAAYSNNITIDGFDNNDDRGASFRFQPSIDAISEVQVVTNQFSAEYGRASGGRVNLGTRSGTNKFRGRAYYYFRDESLNANTWNNNRRGFSRPAFQNHDPGFTFGGPIVKNRLFFFTAYEYDNIKEDTIVDAWVLSGSANPQFALPAPNDPTAPIVTLNPSGGFPGVQVGHYITPVDTPAKKHIFSQRVDWNLNGAHNFTFNYQLGRSNDLRAFSGTNRIANSLIGRIRNTDAFNLTHNYTVSSKLVNQVRFQYSTLDPSSAQSAGATSPAVLVTFTPPGESSQTQVFGSTTSSSDRQEKRWTISDTASYAAGPITWRFGFDYHNVDTTFIDRFDATGTYSFGSFVFFAANNPSRLQQNFNNTSNLKNQYIGAFIQSDWRARSNLTISAGLRYERETVLDDTNNWGPRVAVAWNPFKGDKTVVRFGGGIFYNRVLLRTVDDYTADSQSLRLDTNSLNVPTGVSVNLTTVRNFLGTTFPNGLTLDTIIPVNATNSYPVSQLARPSTVFRSLSPDLVIPESYQFNVGFEREIKKGWVFETNFTFNKTAHLWRETNPNAPVLPSGLTDRNNDGQVTLTDYLLGITTGVHRFYVGSPNDTVGLHTSPDDAAGTCSSSSTLCYINVNTRNSNSSTSCSTTTTTNTPVCRAFAAVNGLRPAQFASLGPVQLEQVAPIGNSRYVGAQFELRSRYKKLGGGFGGSMRFVYTLSRLMDDGIVNTSDPTLPGDFSREWSRSLADRTHRIAVTSTFDTPFWLGKLRFSPLVRWGSSAPFNVSAGGIDRSLDDLSNDRPNFSGDPNSIVWREFSSAFPQSLADQFSLAPIGSPGNLGRNAGNGPQLFQFNLSVSREFKVKERFKIRPTAEFTNILNVNIFSFGSNFINFDFLNSTNPTTVQTAKDGFLAPTRTLTPRRMRVGIRFDF